MQAPRRRRFRAPVSRRCNAWPRVVAQASRAGLATQWLSHAQRGGGVVASTRSRVSTRPSKGPCAALHTWEAGTEGLGYTNLGPVGVLRSESAVPPVRGWQCSGCQPHCPRRPCPQGSSSNRFATAAGKALSSGPKPRLTAVRRRLRQRPSTVQQCPVPAVPGWRGRAAESAESAESADSGRVGRCQVVGGLPWEFAFVLRGSLGPTAALPGVALQLHVPEVVVPQSTGRLTAVALAERQAA
jgi:hypothetical protein